jgi:hypothetical protein
MKLADLNPENYYSLEANRAFMSYSQFKSFQECEAAALAEVRGEYTPPTSPAFLVGGYVDAHFEGSLDIYKAQRPEMFRRDGELKAEFKQAEEAIARAEQDRLFMLLMSGRKQIIKTGYINSVPFKVKIDSLLDGDICREIVKEFPKTADTFGFCDGAIVDEKYVRDINPVWKSRVGWVPFVEAWGYDLQGAIYQRIDDRYLPFILAAITKESPARIAALTVEQPDLDAKIIEVEELAPHYQSIKEGKTEPTRCGVCEYCRQTEILDDIINYKILGVEERDNE